MISSEDINTRPKYTVTVFFLYIMQEVTFTLALVYYERNCLLESHYIKAKMLYRK
jgi:hypothetical protein